MTDRKRRKIEFDSGGTSCVGWHYPGTNGACVVMAGGFAVPKEPATDLFAPRFQDHGFTVLAFDYRHIGESGGTPRQVLSPRSQSEDWRAALAHARSLPGVDPSRIGAWAFSMSAGHVLRVAGEGSDFAAAVVQTPYVGGPKAMTAALRHQTPWGLARFMGRGVLDALGGLAGRQPILVPLAGPKGSAAMLTTPDAQFGDKALNPDGRYPHWSPMVAARSALQAANSRPGNHAHRIDIPVLLCVCDNDQSTPTVASLAMAERISDCAVVRLPGNHYAPFLESHEATLQAQIKFLTKHLVPERGPRSYADPPPRERQSHNRTDSYGS